MPHEHKVSHLFMGMEEARTQGISPTMGMGEARTQGISPIMGMEEARTQGFSPTMGMEEAGGVHSARINSSTKKARKAFIPERTQLQV